MRLGSGAFEGQYSFSSRFEEGTGTNPAASRADSVARHHAVDLRLELVLLPVSDVDRAKAFYVEKVGFNLDVDVKPGGELRIVQMTPPGSACSITIGTGITDAAPGSVRGTHLVTPDIEAARAELAERGVDVSEVFHFGAGGQEPGPDPQRGKYNSFASFSDPTATPGSCRRREPRLRARD